MFSGLKNGWALFIQAIIAFVVRPKLLFPLLLCWCLYAPLIVYLKFHFPWDDYQLLQRLLVVFLAIFLMAIIFSWSAFVLLNLVRHIETDKPMSMIKSFFVGIKDTIRAFPIVFIWACLWFVISVIEMFLSRKSDDDEDDEYNAENVAKTIAGFDDISLSSAFFDALRKGIRMLAFLIYAAIAWENKSNYKALKKGLSVARAHKVEFAAGFVLTDLTAALLFFPPAIMFFLSGKCDVEFSDNTWFALMIYCGFAWSFSLLLEQLFVAELYLWNALWEKECLIRKSKGESMPELDEVKRPSIIDNVPDMKPRRSRK